MLEKTLESPLDCKKIQPVCPKGNQSWIFIGRTDVEAETPILWPPNAKNWLIWKDPDAGKDWGQEEKGMTEDEMVGWHHQLNGHGFGWTPGVGDGQGGLACCIHAVTKSQTQLSDWTELKWTRRNPQIPRWRLPVDASNADTSWYGVTWALLGKAQLLLWNTGRYRTPSPNAERSRTSRVLWLRNPGEKVLSLLF